MAEAPPRLRREHALLLLIAFLALAFGLSFFDTELAFWGDNAQFVVLARSVATGQGMREINQPDRPLHHKYPAGFPLMLAPFELLRPGAFTAMKVMVLLSFVLTAVLLQLLISAWAGRGPALAVTTLFITNRLALPFASQIMSEVPFLLASLLALLLWTRARDATTPATRRRWLAGAAAAGLWALSIRAVGLALIGALALRSALDRRWRRAGLLLGGAALVCGIDALARGSGSQVYLDNLLMVDWYDAEKGYLTLATLGQRVGANLSRYLGHLLPGSVAPADHSPALLIAVALIIGVGLLRSLSRLHVASLYFGALLAILLVWPRVWAVYRFTVPLLPLTLFFLVSGVGSLVRLVPARLRKRVPRRVGVGGAAAAVAGLALCNLWVAVDTIQPGKTRPWQQYFAAMRWIKANVSQDAVVLCRKPYLAYLLAERRTVGVPRTTSAATYHRVLKQQAVNYVVVDRLPLPGTREVLLPRIREAPRNYVPVYAAGRPPLMVLRYRDDR